MPFALVMDGYVDEPACFGVPPYISPYVRYAFGALSLAGMEVAYLTCDAWRRTPREDLWRRADLLVVISGLTVPGRYRGGSPLTLRELEALAALPRSGPLVLGGPIHHGYALQGGVRARELAQLDLDCLCTGDPEAVLAHWCRSGQFVPERTRTYADLRPWAVAGAALVPQHPNFPWVMAEMELSRGCDRTEGRCSFCTERAPGTHEERSPEDVLEEAEALSRAGVSAFRLGRCANILGYGGLFTPEGRLPRPEKLHILYEGFRARCPHLSVLHTDNANPLTIVRFPDAAAEVLEIIVRHNTAGDGLSFGLENVSARVRERNNLKVSAEEALFAVRMVNDIGGKPKEPRGLPALLPGLNFLVGLADDGDDSLEENRRFLEILLETDLSVRRINIRRCIVFPDAPLASLLERYPSKIRERSYRRWKEWVRTEADPAFLARVAPVGTVIRGIRMEERAGHVAFGRALGSYPPLVGVVADTPREGDILDAAVCGHGGRSLTAVPFPLDLNRCDLSSLQALPGIGKARATRLVRGRPFESLDPLPSLLDAPTATIADLTPFFAEAFPLVRTEISGSGVPENSLHRATTAP